MNLISVCVDILPTFSTICWHSPISSQQSFAIQAVIPWTSLTWESNDSLNEAKIIGDWRSRCIQRISFEEVENVKIENLSTVGAQFIHLTKVSKELANVRTLNIHKAYFPPCVLCESQRGASFTFSKDKAHHLVIQKLFSSIMDDQMFIVWDQIKSKTAIVFSKVPQNSRLLSKVFTK